MHFRFGVSGRLRTLIPSSTLKTPLAVHTGRVAADAFTHPSVKTLLFWHTTLCQDVDHAQWERRWCAKLLIARNSTIFTQVELRLSSITLWPRLIALNPTLRTQDTSV